MRTIYDINNNIMGRVYGGMPPLSMIIIPNVSSTFFTEGGENVVCYVYEDGGTKVTSRVTTSQLKLP